MPTLFVNPEPQAGPSRESLPNEAFTSQEPVHGWDLIGPGRVGGLIAYASSRTTDDNELLDQAVVVSRGALGALGTKAVVWINGQRVRFSRQTGTSPDGTATSWYEPEATGSSDGINIYVGSWDAGNGLINRAPVVDDLLFDEDATGYRIIQRRSGSTQSNPLYAADQYYGARDGASIALAGRSRRGRLAGRFSRPGLSLERWV